MSPNHQTQVFQSIPDSSALFSCTDVQFTLQAVVDDNMWAGFGFSDPSLGRTQMIGTTLTPMRLGYTDRIDSDVTVTGLHNGVGFALDYFLTAKAPCTSTPKAGTNLPTLPTGPSYPLLPGVCPDSDLGGTNDVTLVSSGLTNGILTTVYGLLFSNQKKCLSHESDSLGPLPAPLLTTIPSPMTICMLLRHLVCFLQILLATYRFLMKRTSSRR